jgi:hypothetical protein
MPPVTGTSNTPGGIAVEGDSTGAAGVGVKGTSTSGDAVLGISQSNQHAGVSAVNDHGAFGVWARGTPAGHFEGNVEITGGLALGRDFLNANLRELGVLFLSGDLSISGFCSVNIDPNETAMVCTGDTGVVGNGASGPGIKGMSASSDAVLGITQSNQHAGVSAVNDSGGGFGVWARGDTGGFFTTSNTSQNGIVAINNGNTAFGALGADDGSTQHGPVGVWGGNYSQQGGLAGFFDGNISVLGTVFKQASLFRIDHPLDPANKFLHHAAIESPELKTLYDGMAVLDGNGEALVQLPTWFEALNRDFRYQLTAVGAPGPNLHIKEEISNNRFLIAGGKPGCKVSWQVTGSRQDAFARDNPVEVEQDKATHERGKYFYVKGHGMPDEKAIGYEMRLKVAQLAPGGQLAKT